MVNPLTLNELSLRFLFCFVFNYVTWYKTCHVHIPTFWIHMDIHGIPESELRNNVFVCVRVCLGRWWIGEKGFNNLFSILYCIFVSFYRSNEFNIMIITGIGCKVAGFLTVFATHLSVFTLTLITIERWYAITHAIYLNKRIKIKAAAFIMVCGWIYSIVMSSLPLFGFSNYSSTRYGYTSS